MADDSDVIHLSDKEKTVSVELNDAAIVMMWSLCLDLVAMHAEYFEKGNIVQRIEKGLEMSGYPEDQYRSCLGEIQRTLNMQSEFRKNNKND